jgi:hypothetical protein
MFGPGQDALELTEEYGASYSTGDRNLSLINGKTLVEVYFPETFISSL